MLSHWDTTRQNKLYCHLLPNDVISAFVAKRMANGSHGYVQPTMKAVNTMLREMEDGNPDPIALNTKITTVLPIRDPLTFRAKKLSFANHTKIKAVMCFVNIYEDTSENTIENRDEWCRHLIAKFNLKFPDLRIAFGGNASASGMTYRISLDQEFLEDDGERGRDQRPHLC